MDDRTLVRITYDFIVEVGGAVSLEAIRNATLVTAHKSQELKRAGVLRFIEGGSIKTQIDEREATKKRAAKIGAGP